MPFTFDQVLGGISTGMDLYQGYQQGQMQNDALQMMQRSGQLPAWSVSGPGGVGGIVGPGGGAFTLGDLDPIRQALVSGATGMAGNIPTDMPADVANQYAAFQRSLGQMPGMNIAGLNRNIGMAQQQATRSLHDINAMRQNPFGNALMGTAMTGAQRHALAAGGDFGDVEASTLANLRAQAAPHEQQQMNKLGEALFGSGRTGTTGGALQTEAMAKGLAQADLGRQLQARQEARTQQAHAGTMAGQLGDIGTGVRGLQEDLLTSAFGRFGDTLGLASDLESSRYGRQLDRSNLAVSRAGLGLTGAQQQAGFLPQLQGAYMNPLQAMLTAQSGLQTQAMNPFAQALSGAGAQGNLAMGAASPYLSAITNPNFQASPFMGSMQDMFGAYLNR